MDSNQETCILQNLKTEPLNNMESISSEIATSFVSDGLIEHFVEGQNIHEIRECNSSNSMNTTSANYRNIFARKRRGRKPKRSLENKSSYCPQRSFRLKWLSNPQLNGWVIPAPGKPEYVCCKWCKVLLRAHLHDLKKHSTCKKHRKQHLQHGSSITTLKVDLDEPSSSIAMEEDGPRSNRKLNKPSDMYQQSSNSLGEEYENDTAELDGSQNTALNPAHIGFIGAGSMAQALISGFLSNGLVEPCNLIISAPSNRNLLKLKPLGIRTTQENKLVIEKSDMVFLAVKPHIIPEVLASLDPIEGTHNPLFVSVATGLSITRLEAMLNHVVATPRVIRIMPNTPCMVLQGCCVFSLGSNVQPAEGNVIKCLLGSVGLCEEVPEYQIDGVCGLAGSGPAYIYAAIEAMADGGVKMGLPRQLAMALAAQTVKGAATMVLETGKHPGQLKDEVCSPSGTTITAMHMLEKNGFRGALISAVEASANRSKELG